MAHDCESDGCSRRDLIKKGVFGLASGFFGLSLASRIFLKEAYGITPVNPLYDSVIQIFYDGGPSQTDTWDPKPNGPAGTEVFPVTPALGTDVYGMPFSITDRLTQIATLVGSDPAIKLGVIRSMVHGNGDHDTAQEWMNCYWQNARATLFPSTAASMAYLNQGVGPLGIPSVMIRSSNANEANSSKGSDCPTALAADTSSTAALFNMPTTGDAARYGRRKQIADAFNSTYANSRPDQLPKAWNSAVQQAYDLTTSGAASAAFNLTGKTILPGGTTASSGDLRNLTLAQELVKAGIPYVSLGIGGNDSHTDNRAAVTKVWGDTTDPAVAQMAKNLKAAGKRVLIIMGGEFGRQPDNTVGGRDGRDHWPYGFSWSLLSINQSRFANNVAVGDTGANGMARVGSSTNPLKDPIYPGVLGALVYRSMGFPIGTSAAYNVPTAVGSDCPVDLTMATSTAVDQGTWLMQRFGLA